MPAPDPRWIVLSSDRQVGIPQDCHALVEDIVGGVSATQPVRMSDPTVSLEVLALLGLPPVLASVVLVEDPSPWQPQITTGNEGATLIEQFVLRLDFDAAADVQDPQQRLPRRLGAAIGQRKGSAHPRRATPTSLSDRVQFVAGGMA
ncbi:hypothetical protein [Nocardioides limicola]|uniref:hypothetical protein n=1 Tax=Nocardioides limicola TaxID=2803368 RepID=UPI00193B3DCD|nr:hypothetical protein [Nocardioides sp. DJM-14]